VTVTAGGAVTQTGALTSMSGGSVSITAAGNSVALTNAANAFTGTLTIAGPRRPPPSPTPWP